MYIYIYIYICGEICQLICLQSMNILNMHSLWRRFEKVCHIQYLDTEHICILILLDNHCLSVCLSAGQVQGTASIWPHVWSALGRPAGGLRQWKESRLLQPQLCPRMLLLLQVNHTAPFSISVISPRQHIETLLITFLLRKSPSSSTITLHICFTTLILLCQHLCHLCIFILPLGNFRRAILNLKSSVLWTSTHWANRCSSGSVCTVK